MSHDRPLAVIQYERELDDVVATMAFAMDPPDPVLSTRAALLRGAFRDARLSVPPAYRERMAGIRNLVSGLLKIAEGHLEFHMEQLAKQDESLRPELRERHGELAAFKDEFPVDAEMSWEELNRHLEAEQEREEEEHNANCDTYGIVQIDRRDFTWHLPDEDQLASMCHTGDPEDNARDRAALLDAIKLTLNPPHVLDGGHGGRTMFDIREHLESFLPEEDRTALAEGGTPVCWTNAKGEQDALETRVSA